MRKDATDTVVSEGSVNRAVLGLSGWYLSLIPKDKKASCTTVCVLWVAGVGGGGERYRTAPGREHGQDKIPEQQRAGYV